MGKLLFIFRDEKGMAAIVAFSVLFILLTLGAIFLFTMDTELKIGTNQRASTQALYIAEAGTQWGLLYLNDNPAWPKEDPPVVHQHQLGKGQYSVEAEDELDGGDPTGLVLITSTGEVDLPGQGVTAKRIVRIKAAGGGASVKYTLHSNGDIQTNTCDGTVDWTDSEGIYAKGTIYIDDDFPSPVVTILPDDSKVIENGTEDIPGIDMAFYEARADEYKPDGYVFTKTNNNKLFYVYGDCTIDATNKKVVMQQSSVIAEGNITIIGSNTVQMTRDKSREQQERVYYPVLGSLKNITESGSADPADRIIKGLIMASPEDLSGSDGIVHFENIQLEGGIIGREIELTEEVDISYDLKYIGRMSGGLIGDMEGKDWQEIY